MPVSINEQTLVFLSCIVAGLIMGVIYDFFGGIRNGLSLGKGIVFILDTVFWILGVIIFFAAIYITCGGCVRWYVFLGMILGLCFYLVTISHIVMPFMIKLVRLICKLLIKIISIFLLPVVKIIEILSKIFAPVTCFVKSALKKHKNFVKKNVEKFRQIVIILKKV